MVRRQRQVSRADEPPSALSFGFARISNRQLKSISSAVAKWFPFHSVHDGKKYKMLDCKEDKDISYDVVFPSQFSRLLIDYREHPEAKSLAGTRLLASYCDSFRAASLAAANR